MLRYFVVLALFGVGFTLPAYAAKKVAPQPAPADPATTAPSEDADADAAKPVDNVTGIYSTLKSVGGDEDLIGIEVIIVRSREGFRAFVLTADGVPAAPVIVPVRIDGSTVTFVIPSMTGELLEFKGTVSRRGLSGTVDDRPLTLPRRRSYWQ
jgi:hypothetical protein